MKQSSGFIGETAGQLANVSRSIDVDGSKSRPARAAESPPSEAALAAARDTWQDARVAQRVAQTPEEVTEATASVARARAAYDGLRRQAGLGDELPR